MSRARIARKNFAITFPRCPICKEDMLQHLKACFNDAEINYLLVCEESHQDGGPHLHAYIQLKYTVNLKDMRKFDFNLGSVIYHCEIEECRSISQWINYVKKDGCWCDWGTNPLKTAKLSRKELNELVIKEKLETLVDNGTINLKDLPRWAIAKENYKLEKRNVRRTNLVVKWYWGNTGTGKTRKAYDEAGEDCWTSGRDLTWFDGYSGQKYAILDDLRSNSCDWGYLLRLLDIYPLTVPIKGGHSKWCPEVIIITAPCLPEDMFKNHQNDQVWDKIDQLKRRISIYRNFNEEPYNPTPCASEEDSSSSTIDGELLRSNVDENSGLPPLPIPQPVRCTCPPPVSQRILPSFNFSTPEEMADNGFISQGNLPSWREKR